MWRKGNPSTLLMRMQIGAATVESSMELPQKIKNGTALWLSDSTSWILSEETQNTNSKEYMHPCVQCSVIYHTQHVEAAQVSTSRWVDLKAVVHLHNGILLAHKLEGNLTLCDRMDGPGEHYAKWNKPVRERQMPFHFSHMQNLMNKVSLQTK